MSEEWKAAVIDELAWFVHKDDWFTESLTLTVDSMFLDEHDIEDVTLSIYPHSGGYYLSVNLGSLEIADREYKGAVSDRVRRLLAAVVAFEGERSSQMPAILGSADE